MSRADRVALILSIIAVLLSYSVAVRVFEAIPHIEDEIAFAWQARLIADGKLTIDSPAHAKSFLIPFVVDHDGKRFAKYPLGWPTLMGVGVALGMRTIVNPLLAGLAVWLTYRLGKKVFSEIVGALAALLTATSPFFMMNSGSLLSHPFGLVLSTAFALSWLDAWSRPENPDSARDKIALVAAAGTLGVLILTRPLTAVAVALPFIIHGIYLFLRGKAADRIRLLAFMGIILAFIGMHFLWQYAVTGDPTVNPYTLWWEYDRIGFGSAVGRAEGGHSLSQAWTNTKFSIWVGRHDLFGWLVYSWIFLPFGLIAILMYRNWRGLMIACVLPSLVLIYMAYWIGSWLFGPRYYYEGLFCLTLVSAAGIAWLAGWPVLPDIPWKIYTGRQRARPLLVTGILAVLISTNLIFYTPQRLAGLQGLYTISRMMLTPFSTTQAQDLTPALVIVHPERWMSYGGLLELQSPYLDTPFIFVMSRGTASDQALITDYADRTVIHYYPDEPFVLYGKPRPTGGQD